MFLKLNLNVQRLSTVAFLIFLGGFAVGSIIYAVVKLSNHQELLDPDHQLPLKAEETSGKNITLTETKNGQLKWQMKVAALQYNGANTIATMHGVKGQLYKPNGEVALNFEAPEGTFYKKDSRIELTKTVQLTADNGKISMKAPFMTWSSAKDEIVAQGGISFSKADFGRTQAQRAVFSMDFTKVDLFGHVESWIGNTPSTGSNP